MMKKINYISVLFIFVFLQSCATLFTGTTQSFTVNSEPSGAKVAVNGVEKGITPITLELRKNKESQLISVSKEGYQKNEFKPEVEFNKAAGCNLINLVFWIVDAATGAMWNYSSDTTNIKLELIK